MSAPSSSAHAARSRALQAGVIAAAVQAGPAIAPHLPALADALGAMRRLPDPGAVALTFDDGPHPEATPRVLELLAAHGARATFFLVGEQVRAHPGLAAAIAAGGHAIGLHGDAHRPEPLRGPRALAADRRRGRDTITAATGRAPRLHRPPYGAASGPGLLIARCDGMRTVLWSRWGRDWRTGATADSIDGDVLGAGPPRGEIVLLHDADHYGAPGCWRATVAALPAILDACARDGLRTVTLPGA